MKKIIQSLLVVLLALFSSNIQAQTPQYYNNFLGNSSNIFPLGSTTNRVQWIYGPNLFNSNGTTGAPAFLGLITTVYFKLGGSVNNSFPYANFTIYLGQNMGTSTTFPNATYVTGLTQVFSAASHTLTGGAANQWFGVTLNTPFLYNPNQSLVFEMTTTSAGSTQVSQVNGTGAERIWGANGSVSGSSGTGLINFGFDLIPATPCSGTPSAGSISYVPGCPAQVKLTNATVASGISLQWQKRLVCGGTWTNIPGATGFLYTYTLTSQTGPTEYRAYITCNSSGQADTSQPVTVMNVTPCYCSSAATNTADEEIYSVTLNGVVNSYNCTTPAPGPGSMLNRYSNFTTLGSLTTLMPGSTASFSVVVDECDGPTYYPNGVAVFIDWNGDGDYLDAGEKVYGASEVATVLAPRTVNGTFTVPLTATVGTVGMRVMCVESATGSAITPCLSYGYGETEDYLVTIAYIPEVTGSGLFNYQGVYCSGDNVSLTASATGINNPRFLWKKPNNGGWDTTTTLTLTNLTPNQAGNYYVYMLSNNCPGDPPDTSAARIVNITVNPTPGKPVVAPVITYCQGDPFDSIQIYGENLKWYTVPTGGTAGPYPALNTSQPSTVTYYVSQTVDGCEGPRAQLTLSVAPKPAPPQVTSPIGYCQGVPASPLIAQGQNVRWYSTPTGGVGTPIAPTPSTGAQGTVTWYATQTVAGCESKRAPVVVNVSYLPNGLITLGRDFVCQYDTITLGYFGNALPSADYTWTLPEGAQIVSGTGAGPLVIRFDSFGTQRVRLVVDNAGCIGPEAYYDVPVQISPRLTIDMPDNVCAGEIVNLGITYSTPGIDSFIWDFAGAEMMYGSVPRGPFGLKWQSGGEKTVTVIAIDNTCKSLPSFDQILVRDLPNSNITASRTDICAGDSIEFSVPVEPGGSYQWLPHQFFGESNSNQVWGVVDVAKEIKVNVTSIYNCKSTGSLWVGAQPCCEVYFPTAFTPNGDGKNDIFRMLTVNKDKNAQTKAHTITAFRVVNRWGQTVFETGDETTGWDGSFNGKPADMGTYFFYVKYKCADGNFYEERGEVTLVR